MRKNILFFILATIALTPYSYVSGQITLNSNNFPVGGLTIIRGYCLGTTSILGNPGVNQFYDFTNIAPLYHDTINYFSASATPWASYHPGASVATSVTSTGLTTLNYFSSDSSSFRRTGITLIGDLGQGVDTVHGTFSLEDTVISTDYSYGYTHTEHAECTIFNFLPFVNYKINTIRNIIVDGWGHLQTPVNYYNNVLRVKYMEFRYDSAFLITNPVYTSADTSYYYRYFAEDIRHPVVTAYTDEAYNLIYFEYIFSPPVIYGCMDTMAQNYNPMANQSDGNCVYCNVNYSITSDTVICPGGTANLSVSGGTGYLWDNGNTSPSISVNPAQSTLYSVYVSNSPNCHALATVNVMVDQPVNTDFWTTQPTYGMNDVIQFVNLTTNATYYNWDFDDNINGTSNLEFPLHTYSSVGTKNVVLIAGNTCFSDTVQHALNIISSASVEEVFASNSIRIYPNPGNDYITIEGEQEINGINEIIIYNILGEQVFKESRQIYSGPFSLKSDVGYLPGGTYLLMFRNDKVSFKTKWIKM